MTYADSDANAGIAAATSDDDQPLPVHHRICSIKVIYPSDDKNIETHVLHILVGWVFFYYAMVENANSTTSRTSLENLCYKGQSLNKNPKSIVCILGDNFWNDSIVGKVKTQEY